jgi:hypothetical protein
MPLTEQEKLIGKHPSGDSFFSDWLSSTDKPATATLRHRELNSDNAKRQDAIDKIADWLILHHINDSKIKELQAKKRILTKHGFKPYFEKQSLLPTFDKTQKGNGAEVILSEYLVCSTGLDVLVYKLHYNPNIEQSMKGDDVLLLKKDNIQEKVIVGESKFQKTPNRSVVEKITDVMGSSTQLPLSLGFIVDRLRDKGENKLAKQVADLQANLHNGNTEVVNVGFVMSNHNTHTHVASHGNSTNSKLAFLSLAIDDPEDFIQNCFAKAIEKLEGIKECPIHKFPLEYSKELVDAKIQGFVNSLKTIIPL